MVRFVLNLFALIFVIYINYLSNALPFNNQTTSDIANRIEVLFTPAGYVFSIWGLIYLLLTIWVLSGLPFARRKIEVYTKSTSLFILSCFLNSFWLFLWHYEYFLLSVVVMISLLLTLVFLYRRIASVSVHFFDLFPFSIYLGWISVATIANISYVLVEMNWNGFGLSQVIWTVIMLFAASMLAIVFCFVKRDSVYPLVFVWAFIGIGVNNLASYSVVAYTAFVLATIIFIFSIFRKKVAIS